MKSEIKSVRIDMPVDVHRKLKSEAALAGKMLKDYILEILTAKQRGSN